MTDEKKHRIRAGDWLIRVPAEPPASAAFETPFPGMRPRDSCDYDAFTDHAIYVLDATQDHLTVFCPWAGKPGIIVYDRFPGDWRYANAKQVEVTWTIARSIRKDNAMVLELEIKNFPYVPLEVRGR